MYIHAQKDPNESFDKLYLILLFVFELTYK